MIKRILEPELMDEQEQATAYALADFKEPHGYLVECFSREFPGLEIHGAVLDLGCGPGDVTCRFAHRFPQAKIIGIDGSLPMIRLAEQRRQAEGLEACRLSFIHALLPGLPLPENAYDLIISTSLLHHLHNPLIFWQTVRVHAAPSAKLFVWDLVRPESSEKARKLVERYSADEPEVLKRDFYNSLLAAFTPEEVERQLQQSGQAGLAVKTVGDRHMIIFGTIGM